MSGRGASAPGSCAGWGCCVALSGYLEHPEMWRVRLDVEAGWKAGSHPDRWV